MLYTLILLGEIAEEQRLRRWRHAFSDSVSVVVTNDRVAVASL